MIDYPFVKCLHPKRIVNPYTHEVITVPCGHCQACMLYKHQRLSFQCKLESVTSGIPLFVTLTYRNSSIPRGTFVESVSDIGSYDLYDKESGELLSDFSSDAYTVSKLTDKFHLFGDVPVLRKDDLVKFLKRLRYYVSKNFSTAKVRYFAVGEYGPVHFRPHYHLLLWCTHSKCKQAMAEYIHSSWPFGLVDCQYSQGDSCKYVAGYVNSFSSVPEVLKSCSVCPFVLHSIRLGQGFLEGQREKIFSLAPADIVRQSLYLNGKYCEFNLWRSCYAYFFPKCRGYSSMPSYRRLRAYTAYRYLQDVFNTKNLQELSEIVALLVCDYYSTEHSLHSYFTYYDLTDQYYQKRIADLLEYFAEGFDLSAIQNSDGSFNRLVTRIYRDLAISRHFLFVVCDRKGNLYPHLKEIENKLKKIDDFYSYLDYNRLTQFYEAQQLFTESDFAGDYDLLDVGWENSVIPFFYDNFDTNYEQLPIYKRYRSEVLQAFQDSTKHKKLNDINKILFCDD